MADRSVRVRLDANVEGFRAGMSTAAKAVQDFDKRAQGYIQANKASINDLSNTAMGMGAGMLAASGLAAKAAIDWESAWAGVTKTVDGTDEQMASLEAGLRDMAKELPATHAEIAAVAEAAGQLGIAVPNIEGFTRTMIDLGESTNMSAEEAATSLARFMNIMGTSQGDVDKLGSAVVGLGNNFATTESEIVALSMRLAGASAQAGLTEGDVMGIATAMSSVGIEAEAGGSAMSLTMKRIGKAADEGGDKLDLFAQVAGMSAEEFATAWKNNPTEALDAFITGLGQVESQGMTTNGVLSELGITGIRESDALLRLSAASEQGADGMSLLAGAVEMGNEAYSENIALTEEAANRYETTESRLAMMRNAFVDLGIDLGASVAPALAGIADNVSFLIGRFQELPDFAKSALGMGAGVGGMALLAVGGLGKAITSVSDLRLAMQNLGIATMDTSKKMKLLGVGSAVGLAITGLALALGHFVNEAATAERHAEGLADTFDELTGAATADTDRLILDQMSETLEATDWKALDELGVSVTDVIEAVKAGGPELDALRDRLVELGFDAGPEAMGAIGALERALGPANKAFIEGAEAAAFERDALEELGNASGTTAAQQQILEDAVVDLNGEIKDTNEALSEFLDLLFATGLATMSARDAQAAYHETVSDVEDAVEQINSDLGGMSAALNDNKTDFDLTTEAGRTANDAFQEIAQSGMDLTKAMADNNASQDELQGALSSTYDDLLEAARGFGLSEEAAEALTREILGIPDDVDIDTWMDDTAERQAQETKRALDNIPRSVNTTVTTTYRTHGSPSNITGSQSRNTRTFATGGYTGDGGKFEPAGVVHRGEFVTTKEKTAKYRPVLEAIHNGTYQLPGYANGGYVIGSQVARTPASTQSVSASVDSGVIASAVASAMSSWQPVVDLGGTKFYGAMHNAAKSARRPLTSGRI